MDSNGDWHNPHLTLKHPPHPTSTHPPSGSGLREAPLRLQEKSHESGSPLSQHPKLVGREERRQGWGGEQKQKHPARREGDGGKERKRKGRRQEEGAGWKGGREGGRGREREGGIQRE